MIQNARGKKFILGNGKRHRTPTPQGLRKIKRVSLEVFLRLKELVNSARVKEITPRGNRKKSKLRFKDPVTVIPNYVYEYEPSNIIYADDSLLWQWRRVNEWHRYLNDTVEKIKGHMIT